MSNLARKLQQREFQSPKKTEKPAVKKSKITKGEKFFYIMFIAILCIFSVEIIGNQASIYQVNKEIQMIQVEMDEQEKVTQVLQSQVDELRDYSRLLEEAEKLGLKMDENNVKSVHMP